MNHENSMIYEAGKTRTWLWAVVASLAINAAIFALCLGKVSAATGWMFD